MTSLGSNDNNVRIFAEEQTKRQSALKSGGGDGTSGGMEARVKALEDKFDRMDGKLDAILLDLATMKASLAAKDDVHRVSERVAGLEKSTLTFWQFLTVMGVLLAIVLRWPELFRLAGGVISP